MLIKKDGRVYSVEAITRTLIYSVSEEGEVYVHLRGSIKNPVLIPPVKFVPDVILNEEDRRLLRPGEVIPDLVLAHAYTSPARAHDLVWALDNYSLLSAIWQGDLYLHPKEEKLETMTDSGYILVGEAVEKARRYTPEEQLEQLKKFFPVIWEEDWLYLVRPVRWMGEVILILPYKLREKKADYLAVLHFTPNRILYRLHAAEDAIIFLEQGPFRPADLVPYYYAVGARFNFEGEPHKIGCSSFIVKKVEGEAAEVIKKLENEPEEFEEIKYFHVKKGHFIAFKDDEVFLAKEAKKGGDSD